MIYLVGIAAVIYVCYTAFIIREFGIPGSYSKTYYLLGGKEDAGGIFQLIMWLLAALVLVPSLEAEGGWSILAFIPAAALMFVATAPDFKYKGDIPSIENRVHMFASYICAVSATFAIWLKFDMLYLAIGLTGLILILVLFNVKNKTFWMEHFCFDLYLTVLFLSYL